MKIYVSQISEDEGLDIHQVFPEQEPKLRGRDGQVLEGCSLDARATRSADELRLTGRVVATVQLDCARCLAPACPLAPGWPGQSGPWERVNQP